MQMDLEEWELLSDEGLIDHQQQQKMIYSPRSRGGVKTARSLKPAISKSNNTGGSIIEKEKSSPAPAVVVKEVLTSSDHLSKKKDTEFADKTPDLSSTTTPPPPPRSTDPLSVVEEVNDKKENHDANHHHQHEERGKGGEEEDDGGKFGVLNVLKMGKSAVCTFGIAACATVCVLVLGGRTGGKNHSDLHFQIYTDDKRIKQAAQRAATLNDAISAAMARGGGGGRRQAQITTGGHYERL